MGSNMKVLLILKITLAIQPTSYKLAEYFFSFNAASKFHKCLEFCLECVGCSLFLQLVGGEKKNPKQTNKQKKNAIWNPKTSVCR